MTEITNEGSTKKKVTIASLLLLLLLAFIALFIWLTAPKDVPITPVAKPTAEPVTQQETWFKNLDALQKTAPPLFTCNVATMGTWTDPQGNVIEAVQYSGDQVPTYFYSKEELPEFVGPTPENPEFTSCSLNPLVSFENTAPAGAEVGQMSPVDSEVEPALNALGYSNYDTAGYEPAPHYSLYAKDTTAASLLLNELTFSALSDSKVEEREGGGARVTTSEDISLAFQTVESYGDEAPIETIQEMRDEVPEGTYEALNEWATAVLSASEKA